MTITVSNWFIFEATRSTLFVRLPYIGQFILGRSVGGHYEAFVFDNWRTLKLCGEVG